jgi:hypothetical protein
VWVRSYDEISGVRASSIPLALARLKRDGCTTLTLLHNSKWFVHATSPEIGRHINRHAVGMTCAGSNQTKPLLIHVRLKLRPAGRRTSAGFPAPPLRKIREESRGVIAEDTSARETPNHRGRKRAHHQQEIVVVCFTRNLPL